MSQEDGLLMLMERWLPPCKAIHESWAGDPNLIRYEDLCGDSLRILKAVLIDRCGMPVSGDQLAAAVARQSFEAVTGGRPMGQEDIMAHERKGSAGDWRNHFTPAVARRFEELFGEVQRRTGYEG